VIKLVIQTSLVLSELSR